MLDLAMIKSVWALISAPILAFIGYLGWAVRRVNSRVDNMVTEQQVRNIVKDKVDVLRVQHKAFDQRLSSIDTKLDMLVRLHLNNNSKNDS